MKTFVVAEFFVSGILFGFGLDSLIAMGKYIQGATEILLAVILLGTTAARIGKFRTS